jgi:hypothetical protein
MISNDGRIAPFAHGTPLTVCLPPDALRVMGGAPAGAGSSGTVVP